MDKVLHTNLITRFFALGATTLVLLAAFIGFAGNTGAIGEETYLDTEGWAIIAVPETGSIHQTEGAALRAYLLENDWDDERIILLGDGSMAGEDGVATKSNFLNAMTFVTGVSGPEDVVLVAVLDHAVEGPATYYLRFGNTLEEYMSASEFGQALDMMDTGEHDSVVVDIAGTCSWAFIGEAEGPDHVVVTDLTAMPPESSICSFSNALDSTGADVDENDRVSVEEAREFMYSESTA